MVRETPLYDVNRQSLKAKYLVLALLFSAVFICLHQFSLRNWGVLANKNAAESVFFVPGPNLTIDLNNTSRNIHLALNSIPDVDSIELQKWTPSDSGWTAFTAVNNAVYFGDGRQYDFYGGGGVQGGLYRFRARFNYYDGDGIARNGPWSSVAIVWTGAGPMIPYYSFIPGDPCGPSDPKLGGAKVNCSDEGRDADPVNLALGFESYRPKPDLAIYNPAGPIVSFQRTYHEQGVIQGVGTSGGMGLGWSHNYDVSASYDPTLGGWAPITLKFPGGNLLPLDPNLYWGVPTGSFVAPPGSPFTVVGTPSSTTSFSWDALTIKWNDETVWTLTPSGSGKLVLTKISGKTGQYLTLNWSGDNLISVANQDSTTLLTLVYSSGRLVEAKDCYLRSTFYSYASSSEAILESVSQLVPTGTTSAPTKVSYSYTSVDTGGGITFDGLLHQITVPSPTGGTAISQTTLSYDSTLRVTDVTDANGNVQAYTYNTLSTLIKNKDASGNTVLQYTQNFDSSLRNTGFTDANNHTTTYEYLDSANPYRPTKVTNRNGHITYFGYDWFGHVVSTTTPRSVTTAFTYDYSSWPTGRLIQIQRGSETPTNISYFTNGLVDTVTLPKPGATSGTVNISFTYDSLGNTLSKTIPGNNATTSAMTTYSYTTDGTYTQTAKTRQPVLITDANGNKTHLRYDSQGQVTDTTDQIGRTIAFDYDIFGQITDTYFPSTGQTGIGSTHKHNDFLWTGGPISYSKLYDESGTLVNQTHFTYGYERELLGRSGDNENVSFVYDGIYRIKQQVDGNNQVTQYTYDNIGRLSQVTYPGSSTEQYTSYDNEGHLLERIDPRGRVIDYEYNDPDGFITSISYPLTPGEDIDYTYDSVGRLQQVVDGRGSYSYTYGRNDEILSQVTTYTGGTGSSATLDFEYYPDGSRYRVHSIGYQTYLYDAGGRLTSLTNPFGETTDYTYNDDATLNKQTYPNGVTTNYVYNGLRQVTSIEHKNSSGGLLASYIQSGRNGLGDITNLTTSVPSSSIYSGSTSYTFNSKDELTGVISTLNGGYSQTFGSDSAGNLTTIRGTGYSYNSLNQISGTGFTYDLAGNPTTYRGVSATYDTENHLTSFGSNYAAEYRYDNYRACRTIGSDTRYFIYLDGKVLLEKSNSGTWDTYYTTGADGLISKRVASSTSIGLTGSGTTSYYHFDGAGNAVLKTDASQSITDYQSTDPYGFLANTSSNDPFLGMGAKYGYYYESSIGLYYLKNRYFDSTTARFLNRDPIGSFGGINLYSYCQNNSISYVDPDGTDATLSNWGASLHNSLPVIDDKIRGGLANKGALGVGAATIATTAVDFFGGGVSGFLQMGTTLGRYFGGDPCTPLSAAVIDGATVGLNLLTAGQATVASLSSSAARPVIIGETMDRVVAAAKHFNAEHFIPSEAAEAAAAQGNWGPMTAENKAWVDGFKASGRPAYDIGIDIARRDRGIGYRYEQGWVGDYPTAPVYYPPSGYPPIGGTIH